MHQRGFSLLEVLVAFSILALALGVLMRIYSGSLASIEISRQQARALILAQSVLAKAAIDPPTTSAEAFGNSADGLIWRLTVTPYPTNQLMGQPGPSLVRLWELNVIVTWNNGPDSAGRSFELKTLRTHRETLQ